MKMKIRSLYINKAQELYVQLWPSRATEKLLKNVSSAQPFRMKCGSMIYQGTVVRVKANAVYLRDWSITQEEV